MSAPALLQTTRRLLDRRAATLQSTGRIPSLVTGVVRDSHLVWSSARGTFPDGVDPLDLQYRIGSITKTFVAVGLMQLRDAGRLRLNDRLEDHLPGTPFGDRTLAQLLTHTAGITAELPGSWWERSPGADRDAMHAALTRDAVLDRPGRRFHYSNIAFAVLGEVLATHTGQRWDEAITERILQPLQMRRTTARPQPPHATGYAVHPYADVLMPEAVQDTGAMAPAGQLWSTLGELSTWAAFLAGDTAEVLSPDTLAEMCEPTQVTGEDWTGARGLGLQLQRQGGQGLGGRVLVGHGGSMPGFQAAVRVDRADRTGTVMLLNCTTPSAVDGLEDPFDILAEYEPRIPEPWVAAADVPEQLLALTGSWFWGTSEGILRVLGDGSLKIEHVSGMMPTSRFDRADAGADTWIGREADFRGETMRVIRGTDGTVTHLEIATYVLTRRPYQPGEVIPGGLDAGSWPTT